jgi:hypothetical protein
MCDGEVRAWIEQGAIHMKVVTTSGDPVELTSNEARRLAENLVRLAGTIIE